jgi:hypothetical protein
VISIRIEGKGKDEEGLLVLPMAGMLQEIKAELSPLPSPACWAECRFDVLLIPVLKHGSLSTAGTPGGRKASTCLFRDRLNQSFNK